MESQSDQPPLIVIVGETASGKSALAMHVAERFRGEIIAADSRTIYKGMDVGTAKPSLQDQHRIQHHIIDIVLPNEPFTAADFKMRAQAAIEAVHQRNHLPILVGGTGLYIDAVLYNFAFAPPPNAVQRERLQGLSIVELQHELRESDIALPVNSSNPRHLIRQLETGGATGLRNTILRPNTLVLGIKVEREVLRSRIATRVKDMVGRGLVQEVQHAAQNYGWNVPAMQSIGYREFRQYVEGSKILPEVVAEIEVDTLKYAKRQRTWFRRNKSIHWVGNKEDAVDLITTFLNKYGVVNQQSLLQ